MNQINENENKGFSLVELIVVIAIMAVLTSVLAPSLLGYVEKSRMQKDDSAMGEVANAIKLALADQNVYDECLAYNVTNNYSCYADGVTTTNVDANKVIDKCRATTTVDHKTTPAPCNTAPIYDDWHYNDDARQTDETNWKADGNMRGMTLTFIATHGANNAEFVLGSAKVNNITDVPSSPKTLTYKYTAPTGATTLSTMDANPTATTKRAALYNKLRAVIGDSITLSSQTYRNSEYTVFIRMGSTGGNNASAQDAVAVYGEWNGTNLSSVNPTP